MCDPSRTLAVDLFIGAVAGLVATKGDRLDADCALWRDARPGQGKRGTCSTRPPAAIAAEGMANRLGVRLYDRVRARARNVVHYPWGALCGPVCGQLRRKTPVGASGAVPPQGLLLGMLEAMGAEDDRARSLKKAELVDWVAEQAASRTWAPAGLSWAGSPQDDADETDDRAIDEQDPAFDDDGVGAFAVTPAGEATLDPAAA